MIFPESLLTKHLRSSELKQFCSTLLNNYRSCKSILKEMIYTPFKAEAPHWNHLAGVTRRNLAFCQHQIEQIITISITTISLHFA